MSGERWFEADDGRLLRVVPGFRERVLGAAPQHTPRPNWGTDDYRRAARKRIKRADRIIDRLRSAAGSLDGKHVLEVGTGSGLDTVRLAMAGPALAVGVDRDLALFGRGERARLVRRLARRTLARLGLGRDINAALDRLPVRLAAMRADWLAFPNDSFDIVWSRATLEHVQPLDRALTETARVLRPGGIAYHAIDPYFWVRGCHRRGVLDIPWAHARLKPAEIERFERQSESAGRAGRLRAYLEDLNQLTIADWGKQLRACGLELVDFEIERFPWVEELLAEHPEAALDLRPGVGRDDLTACHVHVLMRAPA